MSYQDLGTVQLYKKQSSKNFQQQKVQDFLQKLQLGDLSLQQIIQYGILLLGQTKAGKTTLSHYLCKNILKGCKREGNRVDYELQKNSKNQDMKIGHGYNSQTQIPNQFQRSVSFQAKNSQKLTMMDCPGFSDSKGCYMVVANAYFNYRALSKIKKVKFILTFDFDKMKGVFKQCKNSIQQFIQTFQNFQKIKNKILKSLSFFVTKVPHKIKKQDIKNTLQMFKSCQTIKNSQFYKHITEIIDNIIAKDKYFIFYKAVDGQNANLDHKLLQQIKQKTQYWQRNVIQNNTIDLSQLQFNLGSKIMGKANQFKNQFSLICNFFTNRFTKMTSASQSLFNAIKSFMDNLLQNNNEKYQFVEIYIKTFNKQFNIYNPKQQLIIKRQKMINSFLSLQNKLLQKRYIQRGKILQQLIKLLSQRTGIKRGKDDMMELTKKILIILNELKKVKDLNNYEKQIKQFIYIFYRICEEAKIFIILINFQKNQQLQNYFKLNSSQFANQLNQFLNAFTLQDNYKYSLQSLNIFKVRSLKHLENQQLPIKEISQKYIQLKSLDISYQLSTKQSFDKLLQMKQKNMINKKQNIEDIIQQIKLQIKWLNIQSSYQTQQRYIYYVNKLGDRLVSYKIVNITEQENRKYLKLIIQLYKNINHVYNVIQVYQKLTKSYDKKVDKDSYSVLQQYASFMLTHGRKQDSIKIYQYILDLLPKIYQRNWNEIRQQRIKISKIIGQIGLQTSFSYSQQYFDKLSSKKFLQPFKQQEFQTISNKIKAILKI